VELYTNEDKSVGNGRAGKSRTRSSTLKHIEAGAIRKCKCKEIIGGRGGCSAAPARPYIAH
jgi:hypothetical protein